MKTNTNSTELTEAINVLQIEKESIEDLINDLQENQSKPFKKAIDLLLDCKGRIVVTGIGKSGHIGNKIAATLASTGSPSFFVHPAELIHGDFGMLKESDVMIALSFSGETEELKKVLLPIKRQGIKIVSISGNTSSTLAENSDVALFAKIKKEACSLNLAPTSSTTCTLALGDAIAVTLMKLKNFTAEDFAKSHPGGSLGKKLIKVKDVMREENELPTVSSDCTYGDILKEINNKRLGFTLVTEKNRLVGIITDGDIRRSISDYKAEVFEIKATEIMTSTPKTVDENDLAVTALKLMEENSISDLAIVNDELHPIGIIHLKDLLKAGII